ncbi:hypothetical protein BCR44DRAFT_38422 [Catenaria anguillulae PL171]|uniref:Secreted protein n=1 Tax=Catenaria anguillulae PL171 TaxID=765915 RepID=A0A1Y2HTG6_9FUNG|nr:hypothetical protein BCR44DRAFT_38422 [Catenaria anguillulae PL171]
MRTFALCILVLVAVLASTTMCNPVPAPTIRNQVLGAHTSSTSSTTDPHTAADTPPYRARFQWHAAGRPSGTVTKAVPHVLRDRSGDKEVLCRRKNSRLWSWS